jgi:diguanylate cyclase (GGDEF)-like protein/PAS domain S-box-containing protein
MSHDLHQELAGLRRHCARLESRLAEAQSPVGADRRRHAADTGDYEAVHDAIQAALFVHDPETGMILTANPAAARMYGYSTAEFARVLVADLSARDPAFSQEQAARHIAAASRGEPRSFQWKARDKAGREFWVEVSLSRVRLSGADRVLAEVRDIGERKAAEDALRRTRDLFNQFMGNVGHVFWIRDLDQDRMAFVSPAYQEVFGLDPADLYDRPSSFLDVVHPEDREDVQRDMLAQARGTAFEREYRIIRPDGALRWIRARTFPVDEAGAAPRRFAGIAQDITGDKDREAEIVRSREALSALLDASRESAFLLDQGGTVLAANQVLADRLGIDHEHLVGADLFALLPPGVARTRRAMMAEVLATGQPRHFEDADAGLTLANTFQPVRDERGRPERLAGFSRDITVQRKNEKRLRLWAKVFENTSEAVFITRANGTILDVNPAFEHITGYPRREVLGLNPRFLKSGRHDRKFYRDMWSHLINSGQWSGEIWDRRKSGEVYPKWLTINAVRDEDGTTTHYVAVFADLSSVKQTERRLEHLTHYDPLTGLPNRLLFRTKLADVLDMARRRDKGFVLMFLGLDRFKQVNDTLGHKAGDTILAEAGNRLAQSLGPADVVSRLGGDEFTVILRNTYDPGEAAKIALLLLALLGQPYLVDGQEVMLAASIGIAVYPGDGATPGALVSSADTALRFAKDQAPGDYRFFSPEMAKTASLDLMLENDLRRALETDGLDVHFQPQVDAATGRVTGAEALVRWPHPEQGFISPAVFIPLAERTGLIRQVGEAVLQRLTRTAARAEKETAPPGSLGHNLHLSFNVSTRQLWDPELDEQLARLKEAAPPHWKLVVEITESALMQDMNQAMPHLERIREAGFCLHIDDFGTGYSSLAYLKRLPLDGLKIDKSFIDGVPSGVADNSIVRAVMALGRSMGLAVIAEGVETAEQAEFLAGEGCRTIQGYHFFRPLPETEFFALLAAKTPLPGPDPD